MQDWIETALAWPMSAQPVYNAGDEDYIASRRYSYQYFSPFRPLSFVGAQYDHVLTFSTEPHHDFMFTKDPLPTQQIVKWELIPSNDAAKAALEMT